MPRIYDEERNPIDLCMRCYDESEDEFSDDCDIDADHPDYGDTDYKCAKCNTLLESSDN